MSLYRKIFKRSLFLTWTNKYLWFFGLFAAILGAVGKYQVFISNLGGDFREDPLAWFASFFQSGVFKGITLNSVANSFQSDPVSMVIIVALVLILAVLTLFLVWLTIVSQVGLVNNSAEILKNNKNSSRLGIKEGVSAGIKYFWPALGINIIIKSLVYVFFALLALPVAALMVGVETSMVGVLYIVLFMVFVPLALVLSLILKYAVCYVVVRGEKFIDSIIKSWRLFTKNWLISIEMAAILFVLQFLLTGAVILVILTLFIPFLFFAFLAGGFSISAFFLILSFALIIGIILTMFFGAVFATFEISSWTALFLELTGKRNVFSKIMRLAGGK